jgi:hypothetical protein
MHDKYRLGMHADEKLTKLEVHADEWWTKLRAHAKISRTPTKVLE